MLGLGKALRRVGLAILAGEVEASEYDQACFLLSCLNCFLDFSSRVQFSADTKDQFLLLVLTIQASFEKSDVFSIKQKLQWRPVLHSINRVQAMRLGNKSSKVLCDCLQGMHSAMSEAITVSSRRIVCKFDKCGYDHHENIKIVDCSADEYIAIGNNNNEAKQQRDEDEHNDDFDEDKNEEIRNHSLDSSAPPNHFLT